MAPSGRELSPKVTEGEKLEGEKLKE